jgi:hypothetical protein
MEKGKIKRTFEVTYYDSNTKAIVPVTADYFTVRDGCLVFISDNTDIIAFKEWVFVRKIERETPLYPEHDFVKSQIKLTKKSPLLKKH